MENEQKTMSCRVCGELTNIVAIDCQLCQRDRLSWLAYVNRIGRSIGLLAVAIAISAVYQSATTASEATLQEQETKRAIETTKTIQNRVDSAATGLIDGHLAFDDVVTCFIKYQHRVAECSRQIGRVQQILANLIHLVDDFNAVGQLERFESLCQLYSTYGQLVLDRIQAVEGYDEIALAELEKTLQDFTVQYELVAK